MDSGREIPNFGATRVFLNRPAVGKGERRCARLSTSRCDDLSSCCELNAKISKISQIETQTNDDECRQILLIRVMVNANIAPIIPRGRTHARPSHFPPPSRSRIDIGKIAGECETGTRERDAAGGMKRKRNWMFDRPEQRSGNSPGHVLRGLHIVDNKCTRSPMVRRRLWFANWRKLERDHRASSHHRYATITRRESRRLRSVTVFGEPRTIIIIIGQRERERERESVSCGAGMRFIARVAICYEIAILDKTRRKSLRRRIDALLIDDKLGTLTDIIISRLLCVCVFFYYF